MTKIEKLARWLLYTPIGRYVLRNERILFNTHVAKIFGYYSLQLGLKNINFLQGNKISNHYIIGDDIVANFEYLPIATDSIDLIVCPHILDFNNNYKNILFECHRILVPNGKLLISGFNKHSLFTLFGRKQEVLHDANIISLNVLKDDLVDLQFTIKSGKFFCYVPPIDNNATLAKLSWIEKVGNRWFPTLSSSYFLIVEKNVVSPTIIRPNLETAAIDELQLGTINSCNKNK